MTLSVVGSILVTDRLGPLETQIEPKPASTSRGVDCRISATTLPTGAGPETLVEDWPQAVTDVTARMIRTVFDCRQPTLEEYSASSLAPRCEPLLLKAGDVAKLLGLGDRRCLRCWQWGSCRSSGLDDQSGCRARRSKTGSPSRLTPVGSRRRLRRSLRQFKKWRGRDENDPSVDIAKDADQRF